MRVRLAFDEVTAGAGHGVSAGPPKCALVLLHGLTESRRIFFQGGVPAGTRVIRIDRPGYGESEPPPAAYSYTAFAHDVGALLKELDVQQCVVVGHSSGGPAALAVGLVLGAAVVTRVCLCCSDVEYANPRLGEKGLRDEVLASLPCADRYFRSWEQVALGMMQDLAHGLDGLADLYFSSEERVLWRDPESGMRARYAAAVQCNLEDREDLAVRGVANDLTLERRPWEFLRRRDLASAKLPAVTVIHAEQDAVTPRGFAAFLESEITSLRCACRVRVVPNCGHFSIVLMEEHWAQVLAIAMEEADA